MVDLGLASLRKYPGFIAALRDETGVDPEFIGPGTLRLALDEREAPRLRAEFEWQGGACPCAPLLGVSDSQRVDLVAQMPEARAV